MNTDLPQPLWVPSAELIQNSNITGFIAFVNKKFNLTLNGYDDTYQWSVSKPEEFWDSLLEYSGIIFEGNRDNVLQRNNPPGIVAPGADWFPGIKMNFAENLLRNRGNEIAIIEHNESGWMQKISYDELCRKTASLQAAFRELGVGQGDNIAAFIPNISEAVIGMLAASSLGAAWSSTSTDFGYKGVLDRFMQIAPKVLITADGYIYNGKRIPLIGTISRLAEELPGLEAIIIVTKTGEDLTPLYEQKIKILKMEDIFSIKAGDIEFTRLPFSHPLYIMYSSGTTGKPKCIVHGAGGTLLQHYKELALHTNLKKGDTIFYFTTTGWMMWNWLISSLFIGATVVLYDGSPFYPSPETLWKSVDDIGINVFGTSPKFLSSTEKAGLIPKEKFSLKTLKTVLSTGSPLTDTNFRWVYENVKKDLQLSSISGGTDIISCFMLGCPFLPVYSEEIQCRGLGMKVESFDENGRPATGQKGELVCTELFPSMPVSFLNDDGNELYNKAYFGHFPGVWRHGDYIEITERGGVIVYGRSDATLNPGGVRIGTAEIYRSVESLPEITDSILASKYSGGDAAIALFVVLSEGRLLDEDLIQKIKQRIREDLSPRHVPGFILQVEEVPVTLNGKKVEIAVTKIINGEEVSNREALANPDSLEQFKGLGFS